MTFFSYPNYEAKETENQPKLKNFNPNLILPSNNHIRLLILHTVLHTFPIAGLYVFPRLENTYH